MRKKHLCTGNLLPPHTTCTFNPSSESDATPKKQRREPDSPGLLSARPTAPHARGRPTFAACPLLGTLGGEQKEINLLPPLLFCTYGNLYGRSEAQERGPE